MIYIDTCNLMLKEFTVDEVDMCYELFIAESLSVISTMQNRFTDVSELGRHFSKVLKRGRRFSGFVCGVYNKLEPEPIGVIFVSELGNLNDVKVDFSVKDDVDTFNVMLEAIRFVIGYIFNKTDADLVIIIYNSLIEYMDDLVKPLKLSNILNINSIGHYIDGVKMSNLCAITRVDYSSQMW